MILEDFVVEGLGSAFGGRHLECCGVPLAGQTGLVLPKTREQLLTHTQLRMIGAPLMVVNHRLSRIALGAPWRGKKNIYQERDSLDGRRCVVVGWVCLCPE